VKLLFDQNISFRILKLLAKEFPESAQVQRLGLYEESDIKIWTYAKLNEYTIVTFDSDYVDIANLNGHPPKIIWLRLGNTKTNSIASKLINLKTEIQDFIYGKDSDEIGILEIE
jgi:predicted nuclease of predicted toxin-antitoxin system